MGVLIGGLEVLFGKGDADHALWLALVRLDILAFLLCAGLLLAWGVSRRGRPWAQWTPVDVGLAAGLTALAAALRLAVEPNLSDLGGIGYSRILLGYKGHFGAAQLYSLLYAHAGRDLEHAVLLNRLASTLTVPLVYGLARRLTPATRSFAVIAAALLALHPLHLLFTPTDALPICTSFLAAASYLLLAIAVDGASTPAWLRPTAALGAASGLALLTQVRYENYAFLLPPALYLWAQRGAALRPLWPGAVALALLLGAYTLAALGAGSSFQNPVVWSDVAQTLGGELRDNPIFATWTMLVGTAAALLSRRSAVRRWALLPLLAVLPIAAVSGRGHHFARAYVNLVLPLTLMAGYGLSLLWEARRWAPRAVVLACLGWSALLPVLFWPTLRERHLETAEHDFLRGALATLPPGIDRIIAPDDVRLERETHSTIEALNKLRMIAAAVGARVEIVGMTQYLEHPETVDCTRGNCALLAGALCAGLPQYWFAADTCAQALDRHRGAPLAEQEVRAGSFVDCSIYRGAARRQHCDPVRLPRRLGLYRLVD
ncbi:MAG: hypothetical protein SF182_26495 [Deltaproteobacteria bacterium]|nr:hypothetical protein [Deltaproteobacteria bacterium]